MSISRPFLLALLGAALFGATLLAIQNARNRTADAPVPVVQQDEAPQQAPQPAAQLSPQEALKAAFSTDVKSARFDGKVSLSAQRQSGSLAVAGAYQGGARGELPLFEVDVKLQGGGEKLDAGFVSTGKKGWVTQGEVGYELPGASWEALTKVVRERAGSKPVQLPFDPSRWVKDANSAGSERIDGVVTEHVSASVDAPAALRDVMKLAEQTGRLPRGALPPGLVETVDKAVQRADFDVYVGREDRILRRLTARLEIAPQNQGVIKLAAVFNLSDVNEPQSIQAPAKVREGLPGGELGEITRGLLQGLSPTSRADRRARKARAVSRNARLKATRALADHRKVVILFKHPKGLDDRAVAAAVRAVDRSSEAVIVTDDVANVDRYGSLVEDLGISQTPAVVVVDRRGRASLVEGFVDAGSLAQVVADAR
jgi:hypothetical protein